MNYTIHPSTSRSPLLIPARDRHLLHATSTAGVTKGLDPDWREKARPIQSGSTYPAKEFCSNCGLCDTHYVAHVKDACAFLGDGELSSLAGFQRDWRAGTLSGS